MANLIPWRRKAHDAGESGRSLMGVRRDIDSLFERFLRGALDFPDIGVMPRIDLTETQQHVRVTAEIPGIDPRDVEISIVGDTLTLRGEVRDERTERGDAILRSERRYGAFERTVRLPSGVNADKADAQFKNGLLTITIEKHPGAQAKRVRVRPG